MAMKAYRHGLNYSRFLDLLSAKAKTWSGQRDGKGCVVQESSLAKIIEGSLMVRHMTVLFVPSRNGHPQLWKLHHPIKCTHMKIVIRWAEDKSGWFDSIFDENWKSSTGAGTALLSTGWIVKTWENMAKQSSSRNGRT